MAEDTDWGELHTSLVNGLTSPSFMAQHPELPTGPISNQSDLSGNLDGPVRHFQGDSSIATYSQDVGQAYEEAMTKAGVPGELVKQHRAEVEGIAAQKARLHVLKTMQSSGAIEGGMRFIPGVGRALKGLEAGQEADASNRIEQGQGSLLDYQAVARKLSQQTDDQQRGQLARLGREALGLGQTFAEFSMGGSLLGGAAKAGTAAALGMRAGSLAGRAAGWAGYGVGASAGMPLNFLEQYAERGERSIGLDEQGKLTFSTPDSPASKAWKTALSDVLDNAIIPGVAGAYTRAEAGGYVGRVLKKSLMALAGVEASGDLKRVLQAAPEGGPGWKIGAALWSRDPEQIKSALADAGRTAASLGLLEGVVQAGRGGMGESKAAADLAKKIAETSTPSAEPSNVPPEQDASLDLLKQFDVNIEQPIPAPLEQGRPGAAPDEVGRPGAAPDERGRPGAAPDEGGRRGAAPDEGGRRGPAPDEGIMPESEKPPPRLPESALEDIFGLSSLGDLPSQEAPAPPPSEGAKGKRDWFGMAAERKVAPLELGRRGPAPDESVMPAREAPDFFTPAERLAKLRERQQALGMVLAPPAKGQEPRLGVKSGSPLVEPPESLKDRLERGDKISRDEFLQAGLTAKQAVALEQLLTGKNLNEVGEHPELQKKPGVPYTKERIRQFVNDGLEKLGTSMEAIEENRRQLQLQKKKIGTALSKMKEGEAIQKGDLHGVNAKTLFVTKTQHDAASNAIDAITAKLLKEAEHGDISPERFAALSAEATRALDRHLGRFEASLPEPDAPAQSGEGQAPVRPAGVGLPEGEPGPAQQGAGAPATQDAGGEAAPASAPAPGNQLVNKNLSGIEWARLHNNRTHPVEKQALLQKNETGKTLFHDVLSQGGIAKGAKVGREFGKEWINGTNLPKGLFNASKDAAPLDEWAQRFGVTEDEFLKMLQGGHIVDAAIQHDQQYLDMEKAFYADKQEALANGASPEEIAENLRQGQEDGFAEGFHGPAAEQLEPTRDQGGQELGDEPEPQWDRGDSGGDGSFDFQSFIDDKGGAVNLQRLGELARKFWGSTQGVRDALDEAAGTMFPAMTRLGRTAGEALSRLVAVPVYSPLAAPRFIDKVMGPGATPELRKTWGTALQELRHRFAKPNLLNESAKESALAHQARLAGDQAAAKEHADRASEMINRSRAIDTFIGKQGSPFATEADYQKVVRSPEFAAFLKRWKTEFVDAKMEPNFRAAQGLASGPAIDSLTQIPGLPMNAKVLDPNGSGTSGRVVMKKDPNFKNLQIGKFKFAEEAGLDAPAYDTDIGAIIENSLNVGETGARKAEFYREAEAQGLVKWAPPGKSPEGFKEVPFSRPPKNTQNAQPGDVAHIRAEAFDELVKALDVTKHYSIPGITALSDYVTHSALASTVEAAYHSRNNLTALTRADLGALPGTGLFNLFKNGINILKGDGATQDRLVELARIGAEKGFARPEYGTYDPRQITAWSGKFLHFVNDSMRLTMEDTFNRLVKQGRIENTETNKRDFINQLGQYNRRAQQDIIGLARDLGLGPFATAGTNYAMQGARALTGNTGLTATSTGHQVLLRAEYLGRLVGLLGATAAANYLMWGRMDGDDNTPLTALKLWDDGKGKSSYLNLTDLISPAARGLRETGLTALGEGVRKGQTQGKALDRAAGSIIDGIVHPFVGPFAGTVWTAATGKNTLGMKVAETAGYGESQMLKNLKAAAWNLNPSVAGLAGKDKEAGQETSGLERGLSLLGPFAPRFSGPHAAPEVADFRDALHGDLAQYQQQRQAAQKQGLRAPEPRALVRMNEIAVDIGRLETRINHPATSPEQRSSLRARQVALAKRALELRARLAP